MIKRRYQIQCTRRVSGITFIMYAQNRKTGKPTQFKSFGSIKIKGHKQDSQRQDLLSVINDTVTRKQCWMSEVTGFGRDKGFVLAKGVKEIFSDHNV